MKYSISGFAIIGLLALAACHTPVISGSESSNYIKDGTDPIVAVVADRTLVDEKAMWGAEALYNVPAQAYVTALHKGVLPAPVKAKVKPILVTMAGALKDARSAACYTGTVRDLNCAQNPAKFSNAVAILTNLGASAKGLLGVK